MKIALPTYEILDTLDDETVCKRIEQVARTCYKSESKATNNSAQKMVKSLIKRGHEAMLEHVSFSVKFIVDRGVSHEIVRHRLASYAQESTRYCNYSKSGFGNQITVIKPCFWDTNTDLYRTWWHSCSVAEQDYLSLIKLGASPQQARSVLPSSIKTELVVTMNLRGWRHFLKLRAIGTTGQPHPQMIEVTAPLLQELQKKLPTIFGDLKEYCHENMD